MDFDAKWRQLKTIEATEANEATETAYADMLVPVDVAHVAFVRRVVSAAAEMGSNLDDDRIGDLALVVTEAVANSIKAHQKMGLDKPVRTRCWVSRSAVTIAIEDQGPGFDPDALPPMPPPESPERLLHESGLGVALMEMLADETDIRSRQGCTEVRLVLRASASGTRGETHAR